MSSTARWGRYAEAIGRTGDPLASPRTGPLPLFQPSKSWEVSLSPEHAGRRRRTSARMRSGKCGAWCVRVSARRWSCSITTATASRICSWPAQWSRRGKVRDLLLRNDGDGRFTDVTAEAGLAEPRPTLGCCVGRFRQRWLPDLLLTGVGLQKLFRNTGNGKFEDVTAQATLDELDFGCLGAAFVDLDQDSDLDLILCQFAATRRTREMPQGREGRPARRPGRVSHVGAAPPMQVRPETSRRSWSCNFDELRPGLQGPPLPSAGRLAASDMDGDRDLDLLVLQERAAPAVVVNDRLLNFRQNGLAGEISSRRTAGTGRWCSMSITMAVPIFSCFPPTSDRTYCSTVPNPASRRRRWFSGRPIRRRCARPWPWM